MYLRKYDRLRWVVGGKVLLDTLIGFLEKQTKLIYKNCPGLVFRVEHGFCTDKNSGGFFEIFRGAK